MSIQRPAPHVRRYWTERREGNYRVGRFLIQRLIAAAATLLVMSLVVFLAVRVAGDPRTHMLPEGATPEDYEVLGRRLGLDRPLPVQYLVFIQQVVVGDFGVSISHNKPTFELILERMPATLSLAV